MMETIVLKFGGTSVGSTDRISAVADLIKTACEEASPVVVVSAMSGETNRLIDLAKSFGNEPNKREFDALVSTGEQVSASLVSIALNQLGLKAKSLSAAQFVLPLGKLRPAFLWPFTQDTHSDQAWVVIQMHTRVDIHV